MLGYYGDPQENDFVRLGSLQQLMDNLDTPERLRLGEDMYVCISRRERDMVNRLSHFCDQHMIRFYYIPVSVETLGINLKRELIDDIEVYTTYENPLGNPVNKTAKRLFDVVVALLALLLMLPLLPIIAFVIKCQSPGPVFFKQLRTGIDGRQFMIYKFRSMHVNKEADKVQATKGDPRKFAFGNFMRRTNIDELPQFWNVLKGDMSVVGPRPHMLAHTEKYAQLIGKYMVRHFVKPGVTGWAQVTGFRGETQELWQMEGRVKRDIWYMEHWSIWLDIRIIWLTIKSLFVRDEQAY
jgi:putative colanic acid biosynthesis UDP-glucose lipid carrier transferase